MNNEISRTAVRAYESATAGGGDVNFVLVSLDADDHPADTGTYTSLLDAKAHAETIAAFVLYSFEDDEPQIFATDSASTRHLASFDDSPFSAFVRLNGTDGSDDGEFEVVVSQDGDPNREFFHFTIAEFAENARDLFKSRRITEVSTSSSVDFCREYGFDMEPEQVSQLIADALSWRDADPEPTGAVEMKQAIRLILTLDDHPWNSPETIELCEASRAQLIAALAAAGETYEPPARSRYDEPKTVSPESMHGEPVDDNDPAHLLIGVDGLGSERYPYGATAEAEAARTGVRAMKVTPIEDGPNDLEIEDAHAINEDDTFDEAPKSSHVRDLRTGDVVEVVGERANGVDYSLTLSLLGEARSLRDGRLWQIMGTSVGGTLLAMEQFFDDDTDPEFCAVRVATFVDQSGMGLPAKRRTLLREGIVERINGDRVEDISFSSAR